MKGVFPLAFPIASDVLCECFPEATWLANQAKQFTELDNTCKRMFCVDDVATDGGIFSLFVPKEEIKGRWLVVAIKHQLPTGISKDMRE